MTITNETQAQQATKEKQPIKSIMQQLREKQEKEKEQAIARNKELEEKRKLEQQQRNEEQEKEFRQKKELQQARMKQVFEKHMKEFEPTEIGEADPRKKMEIENLYDELCGLLNKVIPELANFLKLDDLPKEKLFEFIKSDPDKWLPKQYIEVNNVEIPGSFDIDKVIEMEMVPIPETDDLSAIHADILRVWENIQGKKFIYPLINLSDEKGNILQFSLDIEFFAAVDEFLAEKTTTPEQNVIITIMNNLLESLYDLSDLRILKLEKGPAALEQLNNFIQFKGGGANINPKIFRRHPALKQYFEPPRRNSQPATLDELLQ